jgi:hypothetical protein
MALPLTTRRAAVNMTLMRQGGHVSSKVVARYLDGHLVKGTTLDAGVNRPCCHVRPDDGPQVLVQYKDLKALFFVRSLDGDPTHNEAMDPDPTDPRARGATLVSLRFYDGERVVGMTMRYPQRDQFFFLTPVGARSNNIRMLVNSAALVSLEQLPSG